MNISIINHSNGQVSDEELQMVIRAINRQIKEDFAPYWSMSATLRLEGRSAEEPDKIQVADMRGDAVIYLWDKTDVPGALGYHFQNNRGIPFGFVFTEIAQSIGEPWSVTLSHEALELLGDPETNLLVMGPHPSKERDVFHWFEMCDAVQAETYQIDGVAVSNFVLPLYFTGTRDVDEVGARNDFLGRSYDGQTLKSFSINPGGYIGFFDPELADHDTFSIQGDAIALMRLKMKSQAKEARRSMRYRNFANREKLRRAGTAKAVAKAAGGVERQTMASMKGQPTDMALQEGRRFAVASTKEQIVPKAGSKQGGRKLSAKEKKARSKPKKALAFKSQDSWNPVKPVQRKIKGILEELGAVVAVILDRTLNDLSLAHNTVRARINSVFFPSPFPGLLSAEVTPSTTVGALVLAVNDKLNEQGRS